MKHACCETKKAKHGVISIPQWESANKIQKSRCKRCKGKLLRDRISQCPQRHGEAKAISYYVSV